MPNELNLIDAWIFNRLAADGPTSTYTDGTPNPTTGNSIQELVGRHPTEEMVQVYARKAPRGAVYPYIVFGFYKGDDLNGAGAFRVLVKAEYIVQACDQYESFARVGPISDRIDDLLKQAQDVIDPIIIGIRRSRPLQSDDEEAGFQYAYQGGIYELQGYVQGN